jgi:hypothetical protein
MPGHAAADSVGVFRVLVFSAMCYIMMANRVIGCADVAVVIGCNASSGVVTQLYTT